jgi:acyl-CoA thioester hydrolase
MARVKLSLPATFHFTATIPIRITDLNYGGHVGNDTVLSLLHEARIQFLNQFGYSELNIEGVGLIMSDVAIEFKAELFYGDVIRAFVTVQDFTRAGFDMYYKLVREKDEKPVAVAKTGMVCYDYSSKKIAEVPAAVVAKWGNSVQATDRS